VGLRKVTNVFSLVSRSSNWSLSKFKSETSLLAAASASLFDCNVTYVYLCLVNQNGNRRDILDVSMTPEYSQLIK
jgi:hypothetical protein